VPWGAHTCLRTSLHYFPIWGFIFLLLFSNICKKIHFPCCIVYSSSKFVKRSNSSMLTFNGSSLIMALRVSCVTDGVSSHCVMHACLISLQFPTRGPHFPNKRAHCSAQFSDGSIYLVARRAPSWSNPGVAAAMQWRPGVTKSSLFSKRKEKKWCSHDLPSSSLPSVYVPFIASSSGSARDDTVQVHFQFSDWSIYIVSQILFLSNSFLCWYYTP
jgi:hypothetical protein